METDILIIGAGPAGIQAAIHASRKKVNTVLVGKPSNSAMMEAHIENLFGLEKIVKGGDLLNIGVEQVKRFGCTVILQNVVSMAIDGDAFHIITESGEKIYSKAIILATGIARVKLGVPGEKEFFGKGVSYCASCDCNFYKGMIVAIIGSESEAAMSAELMTKYAKKVYWVSETIDADKALETKARTAGVEIIEAKLLQIKGSKAVESIMIDDGKEIKVDGVFIELGGKSSGDLAMDLDITPDIDDTIKVNENCETSVKGVFACGDIAGKPWQVAKAIGQGAVAGLSAAEYVKSLK